MNLQERMLAMTAQARAEADRYVQRAARTARQRLDRTADQVEAVQAPVSQIVDASLKLNQLSASYVERFVRQQSGLAAALLSGGARRLRALADAGTPRDAWETQVETLDAVRQRATGALRDSWTLATDAGRDVAALAETTYQGLRAPVPRRARAKAKAAARTGARSGARKPAKQARVARGRKQAAVH